MLPALALSTTLLLSVASANPAKGEADTGVPIGSGKTKPTVTLQKPVGGWTVDRMLLVEGKVSDATIDPITLSINGDRYLLRTFGGQFKRAFPAAAGKNVVKVIATNLGGTTMVEAVSFVQAPPVPLKVVLTSDMNDVYTDLHIWEPTDASQQKVDKEGLLDTNAMAHVYWANTESPSGGTFFLNEQGGSFDQPGYGPYLYIHRAPPDGLYCIATNYWPSGDKPHTLAILNLTMFEGTPQETRRTVRVPLATPGTTKVLAWVMIRGGKAQVYVPGQDRAPLSTAAAPWPQNLDAATRGLSTDSAGGDYE